MTKDEMRKIFIGSVKASKEKCEEFLIGKMFLDDAFRAAYLDLSRTPLTGIANMLTEDPVIFRESCIDKLIIP